MVMPAAMEPAAGLELYVHFDGQGRELAMLTIEPTVSVKIYILAPVQASRPP
jgi:hypothetical protein